MKAVLIVHDSAMSITDTIAENHFHVLAHIESETISGLLIQSNSPAIMDLVHAVRASCDLFDVMDRVAFHIMSENLKMVYSSYDVDRLMFIDRRNLVVG